MREEIEHYLLMNKNNIVARFETDNLLGKKTYRITKVIGNMPIGFLNITDWLNNRKASKYNEYLLEIMGRGGCENTESFIRVTHAASINDTFWVRREGEKLRWNQVTPYTNEFNEMISKLAFEGHGLYEEILPSVSPELTAEGSFRKCFVRENNDIFIYKRGREGASNAGLEPYCEVLASVVAKRICPESVGYQLSSLHGHLASKCKLFTDETIGYASFSKICPGHAEYDFSSLLRYFSETGFEDAFRRMIVCDALMLNVDRHYGNFGVLFNNNTLDILSFAPVFDFNMAFLPYITKDDAEKIGDYLLGYAPSIGDDFILTGQQAVTDNIRDSLKDLKDFSFDFRGNDEFKTCRIELLESIVRIQANALLSKEKLTLRDVYIPHKQTEHEENMRKAYSMASVFESMLEENTDYMYSETRDLDEMTITVEPSSFDKDIYIEVDFVRGEVRAYKEGRQVSENSHMDKDLGIMFSKCRAIYLAIKSEIVKATGSTFTAE